MLTKEISDKYQEFTRTTIVYSNIDALNYLVLGFISEFCEFLETEESSEAGDMCWYIYRIFDTFEINFYNMYWGSKPREIFSCNKSIGAISSLHKKYIRGDKIDNYTEKLMNLLMQGFLYIVESHNIDQVLIDNMKKLTERKNNNAIKGSGESIKERLG